MTDLHSHILYGVDDGSTDIDMSLEMLEIEAESGTKNVVLTPHCNIPDGYANYINPVIIRRYENLKRKAKEKNININVFLGMEVYASEDIIELIDVGAVIPINKSRYMLVEFSFTEDPMWVSHILGKIQSTGLVPLLAHPERYEFVQEFPPMVYDWIKSGCAIQVNRGSIVGKFGERPKNTVHYLLQHNLVHVVASDGHRPYVRQPILNDAYEKVEEYYGTIKANLLFKENPARVLSDHRVIRIRQSDIDTSSQR